MAGGWKRVATVGVVAASVFVGAPSRADTPVPAAQALFDDAKRLMAAGQYSEACPILQESERLAPGVGTKFNLADCHQHVGRTATAWAEFIAAASGARLRGQTDREEVARARARALEAHLARLIIEVPPAARTSGLEVKRDGEAVGASQWDREIPVDPGPHLVEAREGTRSWQATVDVAPEATVRATVGPLAERTILNAAPTGHSAAPATVQPRSNNTFAIVAVALGAVGVAGLVVGATFALRSTSKYDDSRPYCAGNACSPAGLALRDDALAAGNVATVAVIVGAAALVAGGIVWLTAPSSRPQAAVARDGQLRLRW